MADIAVSDRPGFPSLEGTGGQLANRSELIKGEDMAVKKDRERELGLWQTVGIVAVLSIGLLAFLSRMSLSVDQDQHQARLAAIRAVNNLDVDLNRAFTQTLAGSGDGQVDDKKQINDKLGAALHELENGPHALRWTRRWTPSWKPWNRSSSSASSSRPTTPCAPSA